MSNKILLVLESVSAEKAIEAVWARESSDIPFSYEIFKDVVKILEEMLIGIQNDGPLENDDDSDLSDLIVQVLLDIDSIVPSRSITSFRVTGTRTFLVELI